MRTRRHATKHSIAHLAPRHVLEAEFAQRATDGLMDLETAKTTTQIAAELAGGNIDNEELEELWGPGSRTWTASWASVAVLTTFLKKTASKKSR